MRSLRLRFDARRGVFVLSAPVRTSHPALAAFLAAHEGWMREQAVVHARTVLSGDGEEILLRGAVVSIVRSGRLRGIAELVDGQLVVPGDPASCARRVRDFLKREARGDILPLVARMAEAAGVTVSAVSLRDQKSRWGSCTRTGRLAFSLRLVMAPPFVLEYVVAHEVAHLVHLNHGPAFWRVCADLVGEGRVAEGRSWLRRHGQALQAVGLSARDGN